MFTDEQVRIYAENIQEGDALKLESGWREVRCELNGFIPAFKVVTLEDYQLQGGEKVVWLDEDIFPLKTGEVFTVKEDDCEKMYVGNWKLFKLRKLKGDSWGVIPKFDQVKKREE